MENPPKLPKKVTNLVAGAILATSAVNTGQHVSRETPPPPRPDKNINLPDFLNSQIIKEHQDAILIHEKDVAPLLENKNTPEELKYLLKNTRVDFFDMNSGDQIGISVPGKSHLMILATNISSNERETKEIEIMEAYDSVSDALKALESLGFVVDFESDPLNTEQMDNGIRKYIQVDLQLGDYAKALDLELPANFDPQLTVTDVAHLVIEEPAGREAYVRDFLQGDPDKKFFFGAIDRYSSFPDQEAG